MFTFFAWQKKNKCSQFPVKTDMKESTETSFSSFSGVVPLLLLRWSLPSDCGLKSAEVCNICFSAILAHSVSFKKIWPLGSPLRKKRLKLGGLVCLGLSLREVFGSVCCGELQVMDREGWGQWLWCWRVWEARRGHQGVADSHSSDLLGCDLTREVRLGQS